MSWPPNSTNYGPQSYTQQFVTEQGCLASPRSTGSGGGKRTHGGDIYVTPQGRTVQGGGPLSQGQAGTMTQGQAVPVTQGGTMPVPQGRGVHLTQGGRVPTVQGGRVPILPKPPAGGAQGGGMYGQTWTSVPGQQVYPGYMTGGMWYLPTVGMYPGIQQYNMYNTLGTTHQPTPSASGYPSVTSSNGYPSVTSSGRYQFVTSSSGYPSVTSYRPPDPSALLGPDHKSEPQVQNPTQQNLSLNLTHNNTDFTPSPAPGVGHVTSSLTSGTQSSMMSSNDVSNRTGDPTPVGLIVIAPQDDNNDYRNQATSVLTNGNQATSVLTNGNRATSVPNYGNQVTDVPTYGYQATRVPSNGNKAACIHDFGDKSIEHNATNVNTCPAPLTSKPCELPSMVINYDNFRAGAPGSLTDTPATGTLPYTRGTPGYNSVTETRTNPGTQTCSNLIGTIKSEPVTHVEEQTPTVASTDSGSVSDLTDAAQFKRSPSPDTEGDVEEVVDTRKCPEPVRRDDTVKTEYSSPQYSASAHVKQEMTSHSDDTGTLALDVQCDDTYVPYCNGVTNDVMDSSETHRPDVDDDASVPGENTTAPPSGVGMKQEVIPARFLETPSGGYATRSDIQAGNVFVKCHLCQTVVYFQLVRAHLDVHKVPEDYHGNQDKFTRCEKCDMYFRGQEALRDHVTRVDDARDERRRKEGAIYEDYFNYECPHCRLFFMRQKTLKMHVDITHKVTLKHATQGTKRKHPDKHPAKTHTGRTAHVDLHIGETPGGGHATRSDIENGSVYVKCCQCQAILLLNVLPTHQEVHKQPEDYLRKKKKYSKCEECNLYFTKKEEYQDHKKSVDRARKKRRNKDGRIYEDNFRFRCHKCQVEFLSEETLQCHVTIHEERKREDREEKRRRLKEESERSLDTTLTRPGNQTRPPGNTRTQKLTCGVCTKICRSAAQHETHEQGHWRWTRAGKLKPYRCVPCMTFYNTPKSLMRHLAEIHGHVMSVSTFTAQQESRGVTTDGNEGHKDAADKTQSEDQSESAPVDHIVYGDKDNQSEPAVPSTSQDDVTNDNHVTVGSDTSRDEDEFSDSNICDSDAEDEMESPAVKCKVCGFVYTQEVTSADHVTVHHPIEVNTGDKRFYSCKPCNMFFVTSRQHDKHFSTAHPEVDSETHTCNLCDDVFKVRRLLYKHQKFHEPFSPDVKLLKPFHCCACAMFFEYYETLVHHMKVAHDVTSVSKTKMKCWICSHAVMERTEYLQHFESHQEYNKFGRRPYLCDLCMTYFRRPRDVLGHKCYKVRDRKERRDIVNILLAGFQEWYTLGGAKIVYDYKT